MAKTNRDLRKAKSEKNDEFYTRLIDVSNEMMYYRKHFENKIVYCNCDDSTQSAFWQYFHLNFNVLKLKKLISTHYSENEITYKMEYEGGDDNDVEVGVRTRLEGNGDFRNKECLDLLDEADIIATNPPFSLFREYIATLIEHDKKFIIWGNNNAITYCEIFRLLKENKLWLGKTVNKTCAFRVPDNYSYDEKLTNKINDGYKYGSVPAISVFTNLDIKKRHDKMNLFALYNETDYPKYDNYDAINVNEVMKIPKDYNGIMGVPITFMDKYNPEQFELMALVNGGKEGMYGIESTKTYNDFKEITKDGRPTGKTGSPLKNNPILKGKPNNKTYYMNEETGEYVYSTYARILIKRKEG